jgi:preprotein translocase subunit SecD
MRGLLGLAAGVIIAVGACTGAAASSISEAKGFSIHEVSAEAGLHPRRPNRGDEKVLTNDGHAYWLRPSPVLRGGIVGVDMGQDNRTVVLLRLAPDAAKGFSHFAANHAGRSIAFVLDGRMIGAEVHIAGGWRDGDGGPKYLVVPAGSELMAMLLADQFSRAIEGNKTAPPVTPNQQEDR